MQYNEIFRSKNWKQIYTITYIINILLFFEKQD